MAKKAKKKTAKKPVKKAASSSKRPAKKAAKAAKKTAVQAVRRPGPPKPAPKAAAEAPKTGVAALPPEKQIVGGVLLGEVDDFFAHVNVAALKLKAPISVGDMIRVKGHTTDITQKVESMQIEHQPVQTATVGDSIGIKIADKARKGDVVYKI